MEDEEGCAVLRAVLNAQGSLQDMRLSEMPWSSEQTAQLIQVVEQQAAEQQAPTT